VLDDVAGDFFCQCKWESHKIILWKRTLWWIQAIKPARWFLAARLS
jgi:hypothetical protein